MRRENWSELATFAAIVEQGGFTRAAATLGVSPSALSHAMRALEARLGVRLLNRTTRSVAPTAEGASLLARLRPAMAEVEAALEDLKAGRDRPVGRVRISAHRTAATETLLPRLARFADDYPGIEVELVVDDGLVDIVAERFDAGVRHEQTLDDDMVCVRIGDAQRLAVVATPAHLACHGTPERPEDLLRHRCVNYRYTSTGAIHRWRFVRDGEHFALAVAGVLLTNDADLLLEAALCGIGLACVPESRAERHVAAGTLTRILRDWCPLLPPNTCTTRAAARTARRFAPSSTPCGSNRSWPAGLARRLGTR